MQHVEGNIQYLGHRDKVIIYCEYPHLSVLYSLEISYSLISQFVYLSYLYSLINNRPRATCCDFFPQVSADNSAEEADHIETNGAASMCSAAIFSSHIFTENEELVQVKSQRYWE